MHPGSIPGEASNNHFCGRMVRAGGRFDGGDLFGRNAAGAASRHGEQPAAHRRRRRPGSACRLPRHAARAVRRAGFRRTRLSRPRCARRSGRRPGGLLPSLDPRAHAAGGRRQGRATGRSTSAAGSGYGAAILAAMGAKVVALEFGPGRGRARRATLLSGRENVTVVARASRLRRAKTRPVRPDRRRGRVPDSSGRAARALGRRRAPGRRRRDNGRVPGRALRKERRGRQPARPVRDDSRNAGRLPARRQLRLLEARIAERLPQVAGVQVSHVCDGSAKKWPFRVAAEQTW